MPQQSIVTCQCDNSTYLNRFLHDVITAVINDTGTLSGLFDGSEMNSDNVKVRAVFNIDPVYDNHVNDYRTRRPKWSS